MAAGGLKLHSGVPRDRRSMSRSSVAAGAPGLPARLVGTVTGEARAVGRALGGDRAASEGRSGVLQREGEARRPDPEGEEGRQAPGSAFLQGRSQEEAQETRQESREEVRPEGSSKAPGTGRSHSSGRAPGLVPQVQRPSPDRADGRADHHRPARSEDRGDTLRGGDRLLHPSRVQNACSGQASLPDFRRSGGGGDPARTSTCGRRHPHEGRARCFLPEDRWGLRRGLRPAGLTQRSVSGLSTRRPQASPDTRCPAGLGATGSPSKRRRNRLESRGSERMALVLHHGQDQPLRDHARPRLQAGRDNPGRGLLQHSCSRWLGPLPQVPQGYPPNLHSSSLAALPQDRRKRAERHRTLSPQGQETPAPSARPQRSNASREDLRPWLRRRQGANQSQANPTHP